MSDDEFYYDDDDDWYWYEEDNMGLGDDLAENAIHSPIMVEDPSLETVDTYSDWEYYSDDYYDDDPTITTTHNTNGEPRRKRQKLSSIGNIPALELGSSIVDSSSQMADSFKGVLWRVPVKEDEKMELYEPGKEEKVALLSDWRELFNAPVYQKDWFANGSKTTEINGEDRAYSTINDQATEPENAVDTKYGRYSPPPLAIENLDKTISRQREKLSQPEKQNVSEQVPAERMIVADSEEEEELDETIDPMAVEGDAADDDKENNVSPENEDESPQTMSVRVEIPTLAAALKEDSLNQSAPPPKKGRTPKNSLAATETNGNSTTKKTATRQTPTKRKRADNEEEQGHKRRSKRVASSPNMKARNDKPDKKRTRAGSMASPREERGKRKKV
ncbi:conserved hypothetical protein [Talaromyces stipitatus ATCC 10500]|uniref:Uncharacterized protein n=1 Tax=Talaromyces stipitatus (strain ATCC 10500 / CBS 375.48 / QM 6759 / NRRL 1006) TaxID=441959 RepID=B8MCX6_TALSN|nr:uncharacterized protein TSTA_113280 [Talaromyces stipitatus ATCC 10500]EED17502.1 conserved hypothetical protein [Talaromyces stipitatus ATCC 10500]